MKYQLFIFLAGLTLFSCKNTTTTEAGAATEEVSAENGSDNDPDLLAITDVIHGFYKWYETNANALANINYVKGGKSSTLDNAKLDAYYASLKQSGFISQAYIDEDRAYLKNLEATAWKNENVNEEPLTGLDYDRFFCAQDYEIAFWTTAPVYVDGLGTDKVKANLTGLEGGSERTQNFELVKENGKWLISKIICDEGDDAQSAVEQLAAFYTGTLPCKDCDGIATVLTLNADEKRTYTLEEEYKGKKPKTVESNGTWTVEGDMVTLTGKSGSSKYQVTAEGLIGLNADGSKRDSKYLLKKTQGE
ncbi:MAG: copper resistance protein NlpE N-terminal domain-containing protein [Saprospiraceae bacterium]|nr:copper resistance protein NlpE N-terminal domain-containing protein [Saprospiraceae bacterium]